MSKVKSTGLNLTTNKVIIDGNVFYPTVKHGVGIEECGAYIVTVDDWWCGKIDAKFCQNIAYPTKFRSFVGYSPILRFGG